MATATVTLTELGFPHSQSEANNFMEISGTAAIQASPATYATGGLAISWASLGSNRFSDKGDGTNSGTPYWAVFQSEGPVTSDPLYNYVWNKATEKLQIYTGGTEATNSAAIPAGVSGDVIAFTARFLRF